MSSDWGPGKLGYGKQTPNTLNLNPKKRKALNLSPKLNRSFHSTRMDWGCGSALLRTPPPKTRRRRPADLTEELPATGGRHHVPRHTLADPQLGLQRTPDSSEAPSVQVQVREVDASPRVFSFQSKLISPAGHEPGNLALVVSQLIPTWSQLLGTNFRNVELRTSGYVSKQTTVELYCCFQPEKSNY